MAEIVDTNTPKEGLDMKSGRKFQAKHSNQGGLKKGRSHVVWSKTEKV